MTDRVTVAICTYRRPAMLAALLRALPAAEPPPGADIDVVVVDNDPSGSAGRVVDTTDAGWPVRYLVEPRPGIAAARNAALGAAADSTYVVFIDDDEEPATDWLVRLVETARRYDADAVAGPTFSRFAGPLPAWIARGGFFERPMLATGTPVSTAASGNLLLRTEGLARIDRWFDDRFGLTGGEDTDLTARLVQAGGLIVWCQEATTFEYVPAGRLHPRWVVRRAYRSGNTAGRVQLGLHGGRAAVRARVGASGLVRVAAGIAELPVALVVRRRHWAVALRRLLRGAGMVAAALGHGLREYRRA
jgi:succinoglycan biosynthesis protein ExoM